MYKSTSRVFSYVISYEKMKEFLENRGYTIITAIQALKTFDKNIMKYIKNKCGTEYGRTCLSGLNYSFAYKESEKDQFFFKFSKIVKDLYNDDIPGNEFFYGKYFWLHKYQLYNCIVDIKAMSIINDEFEKTYFRKF